jgi:hypothetical protein
VAYAIYAAPIPVPEEHRGTMLGMRFPTEKEALERAWELRGDGWHVYRISGPNGYEITEQDFERICGTPDVAAARQKAP